jgi:hypothetical protein
MLEFIVALEIEIALRLAHRNDVADLGTGTGDASV